MWTQILASVPITIITLYILSIVLPGKGSQYSAFAARCTVAFLVLITCATYGVVASIFLRIVGRPGLAQWTVARSFKWTMLLFANVTFEIIQGEEYLSEKYALETAEDKKVGRKARVIVGNHQTELDILMLGIIFPKYCSVSAKKSLKWAPFLGQFMALSKTVFIDRANAKNARATFDSAADTMRRDHQSVYIFPEGTRSYAKKPMLLPFKKGAFHLAVQAQVPIVPVAVANYSHILDFKRKIFWGGKIPIIVLKPIPTKGMTTADVDELTQRVRNQMLAEIEKLALRTAEEQNGAERKATAVSSGIDTFKGMQVGGRL